MSKLEKIVVTGAAGLIGSHLTDGLLEDSGLEVVGLDDLSAGRLENLTQHQGNPRFHFQKLDVRQGPEVAELCRGASTIVHLGARKKISESQPGVEVLTVNTRGMESVLEAARINGCKVLVGSTSDVYGTSPELPFREDQDLVLGPTTAKRWAYAVSKIYDEHVALAYSKDYGVPVTIIRYFGGFSPRSSFTWSGGHVPLFIDWVLKDQEVVIHGDGSQTRCMGDVRDMVRGTLLALRCPEAVGEIINLGNDEELSVLDCARLIHQIAQTGRPLRLKFIPMKEIFGSYRDISRRIPDLGKAKRLFGFEPRFSFEQALRDTIAQRKEVLGLA